MAEYSFKIACIYCLLDIAHYILGPIPKFYSPCGNLDYLYYNRFCIIFCFLHLLFIKFGARLIYWVANSEMQSELIPYPSFQCYISNKIKGPKISDLKTTPNIIEIFWSCSRCIYQQVHFIDSKYCKRHVQNHWCFKYHPLLQQKSPLSLF